MKEVYVLVDYENSLVHGVFSNRELAKKEYLKSSNVFKGVKVIYAILDECIDLTELVKA